MDTVDLNIFLSPSDNIVMEYKRIELTHKEQISGSVTFEELCNVPHLSLYQFSVSCENLSAVIYTLENISASLTPFNLNPHLDVHGNNLFWSSHDAKNDKNLNSFHEKIVNTFKEFRSPVPLKQIQAGWEQLPSEEKALVEQYGVCWGIPGFFNPHLTVLYNISDPHYFLPGFIEEFQIQELTFTPSVIGLAMIGFHGNIEKVLFTKNLS